MRCVRARAQVALELRTSADVFLLAARLYEEIAHSGITGLTGGGTTGLASDRSTGLSGESTGLSGRKTGDVPDYVFRNLGVCYSQLIALAKDDADRVRACAAPLAPHARDRRTGAQI